MNLIERLRQFADAADIGCCVLQPPDAEWLRRAANEIESRRIDESETIKERREDARWSDRPF